jgi:hypothetical protein
MSTGTEHAARTIDNASLADALISLAGLLRTNPQLPRLYSVHVSPVDYRRESWQIQLHASAPDEQDGIDAVRTLAAAFGPDTELHLDEPYTTSSGNTFRTLTAHAQRPGIQLEAWTHVARTTAPAKDSADEQH